MDWCGGVVSLGERGGVAEGCASMRYTVLCMGNGEGCDLFT